MGKKKNEGEGLNLADTDVAADAKTLGRRMKDAITGLFKADVALRKAFDDVAAIVVAYALEVQDYPRAIAAMGKALKDRIEGWAKAQHKAGNADVPDPDADEEGFKAFVTNTYKSHRISIVRRAEALFSSLLAEDHQPEAFEEAKAKILAQGTEEEALPKDAEAFSFEEKNTRKGQDAKAKEKAKAEAKKKGTVTINAKADTMQEVLNGLLVVSQKVLARSKSHTFTKAEAKTFAEVLATLGKVAEAQENRKAEKVA